MAKDTKIEILYKGRSLTPDLYHKALIKDTKIAYFVDKQAFINKIKRQESILSKLCAEIVTNIKNNQLSGQVVKEKTGTMKRSVKFRLKATSTGLTAEVYTDSKLAKLYIDGANGVTIVKAHKETRTKVFRQVVPAYTRNVPEQRRRYEFRKTDFIRKEVTKARPKIIQQLSQNIMRDFNK